MAVVASGQDIGSWEACHEFEPSNTKHRFVNLSRAKRPPVGVVWLLEERVPDEVLFTSLVHGSKFRGPSPKALVSLKSATLMFSHSL
ncbi:hypothetical protein TNCV_4063241 [Trichonephila clavipes]|nr:hypothetical protein TNCV_4063241 [Trichonephila clavipes]